jgi:hypothetical protein
MGEAERDFLGGPERIKKLLPTEPQYLRALIAGFARQYKELGETLTRIEESADRLKDKDHG